ncbi:MAG TPA: class I SAM-dependent rRNA methyltransferase, partial [Trebonia sp.]
MATGEVPLGLPRQTDARVILKPGRQGPVRRGRRWVYRTEIDRIDGEFEPGDTVTVYDAYGRFVARGFINPRSMITVRVLTDDPGEPVDEEFWVRRLNRAWNYRRLVLDDLDACRVVFAEADGLPALIVDKFGEVLVLQTLALGVERWKPVIVRALDDIFLPVGIYERNDAPVRGLEGLEERAGFIKGPFDPRVMIREGGLRLLVDVANGQKTGHFLDQRDNRLLAGRLARGARVLDAFCYTGGFACQMAAGGAGEVTAVDTSADALGLARENARLNGCDDRITFVEANAFDFLRSAADAGERYDLIVLDPPAFAKNRRALEAAYRGYKEINLRAMRMLVTGGILITCSCSHPMDRGLFEQMLLDAANDVGRRVRIVERRGAAPDHPVLLGAPETEYLKCYVLHVW